MTPAAFARPRWTRWPLGRWAIGHGRRVWCRRRALPSRVAVTLAGLIADHLLEALQQRADLPIAVMDRVRARLAPGQAMAPDPESALLEAVRLGERGRGAAALASAAGLPLEMIERAILRRGLTAITALVWKAGLSAGMAVSAQRLLIGASPRALIYPDAAGGFALTEAEMDWQLALLDDREVEPPH